MKRALDFCIAFVGILTLSPVLILFAALVWIQDRHSPLYIAPRTGLRGNDFSMIKLRSMSVGADKTGVDSTAAHDVRITPIGKLIRNYKLDEITQLWNVLIGDMSIVGPRPNVRRETDLYTNVELKLLTVRPGITDFASIVFSDEGLILQEYSDPDLAYNQLIRPWKSALGIFYIHHRSLILDIQIIVATITSLFSRPRSLRMVHRLLKSLGASQELLDISLRAKKLIPCPPPGSSSIVVSRG